MCVPLGAAGRRNGSGPLPRPGARVRAPPREWRSLARTAPLPPRLALQQESYTKAVTRELNATSREDSPSCGCCTKKSGKLPVLRCGVPTQAAVFRTYRTTPLFGKSMTCIGRVRPQQPHCLLQYKHPFLLKPRVVYFAEKRSTGGFRGYF